MPRTYKGGVRATTGNEAPVDPLRAARLDRKAGGLERTYYPSPAQAARGILASPTVMNELLRQMAWHSPEQLDALLEAWKEAKAGRWEQLERYRTRPVSEWP